MTGFARVMELEAEDREREEIRERAVWRLGWNQACETIAAHLSCQLGERLNKLDTVRDVLALRKLEE